MKESVLRAGLFKVLVAPPNAVLCGDGTKALALAINRVQITATIVFILCVVWGKEEYWWRPEEEQSKTALKG